MSIEEKIKYFKGELPSGVKLVAVSKFHPLDDIVEAYSAGQRIFAESRPQELCEKIRQLRSACGLKNYALRAIPPTSWAPPSNEPRVATVFSAQQAPPLSSHVIPRSEATWESLPDIQWHFIGHLQTNKLKLVLPYVTLVQSVDSLHLLEAIDRWCISNGRRMDVLLEYHVSADESKQGFTRDEILAILDRAGDFAGINFRGLMGMASLTDDESVIRSDFARIQALFNEINASTSASAGISAFDHLSIGMSGDWRIAIEYGSTMVRIGTAIFGERKY